MRFLLSKSPAARLLRQKATFKIVPMINVDGVIGGNYRTGFAGLDINRMFGSDADSRLTPESVRVKEAVKKEERVAFFFDVHGHSSKKSVFLYGPRYPLHSEHYLKIRLLPKLIAQRTDIFRYYSCRFANEKRKQNCSRLAVNREFDLPNSYTLECSMWGYICGQTRQTVDLSLSNLQKFATIWAGCLRDWFTLFE